MAVTLDPTTDIEAPPSSIANEADRQTVPLRDVPRTAVRGARVFGALLIDWAGQWVRAVGHGSRKAMAGGVAVLGAVVLGMLMIGSTGVGSDSASASTAANDLSGFDSGSAFVEQCVRRWNVEDGLGWQGQTQIVTGQGRAYVSVGSAADYPDQCLVTVASPAMRTAMQFVSGGSSSTGGDYGLPHMIDGANLDPSLTNWNASIDSQGRLSYP